MIFICETNLSEEKKKLISQNCIKNVSNIEKFIDQKSLDEVIWIDSVKEKKSLILDVKTKC